MYFVNRILSIYFPCALELTVGLSRRADQTARDGGGAKTTLPAHPAHEATL